MAVRRSVLFSDQVALDTLQESDCDLVPAPLGEHKLRMVDCRKAAGWLHNGRAPSRLLAGPPK